VFSSVLNHYKHVFIVFIWTIKLDPSGTHIYVNTENWQPRAIQGSENIVRPF